MNLNPDIQTLSIIITKKVFFLTVVLHPNYIFAPNALCSKWSALGVRLSCSDHRHRITNARSWVWLPSCLHALPDSVCVLSTFSSFLPHPWTRVWGELKAVTVNGCFFSLCSPVMNWPLIQCVTLPDSLQEELKVNGWTEGWSTFVICPLRSAHINNLIMSQPNK